MNRSLLVLISFLAVGCVDTAEPTGPGPTPPGDEGGELTSSVVWSAGADGSAAAAPEGKRKALQKP